jgi:hypothetical protein
VKCGIYLFLSSFWKRQVHSFPCLWNTRVHRFISGLCAARYLLFCVVFCRVDSIWTQQQHIILYIENRIESLSRRLCFVLHSARYRTLKIHKKNTDIYTWMLWHYIYIFHFPAHIASLQRSLGYIHFHVYGTREFTVSLVGCVLLDIYFSV